ncbi:uncharacterized protein [Coffea arabica]|uniref:Pro-resilin-like n=1 Tax=Coffea arabica TaxID=13443 RepID=A0ABM4VUD9_COFAR
MSYFRKDHSDDVEDFDEYDPTPYSGGYDISLTYGRPLPPSEETCYCSSSSTSESFDYDRPQYSSYAEPSAYGDQALENEYKSYVRPKPRPGRPGPPPPSYGAPSGDVGGYGHDNPQPNYAFQPGVNRPGAGGYGGESEYGGGGFGSEGYGRTKPPSSEYGSGYQRPGSEYERPTSEYGSGYGRKPEYERPSSEYGSGGYQRPSSEYGSGGYQRPTSEYGSGGYERPTSEEGVGEKSELKSRNEKGAWKCSDFASSASLT